MASEIFGFVPLEKADYISPEALRELDRVLKLLQGQGWSGFITADEALQEILAVQDSRHLREQFELLDNLNDRTIETRRILREWWDGP